MNRTKLVAALTCCIGATLTGTAFNAVPALAAASKSAAKAPPLRAPNYYQYESRSTRKCLNSRTDPGNTAVRLVGCHPPGHVDIRHQLWRLENDRTMRPRINTGICLTALANTGVRMERCDGGRDQKWTYPATATGRFKNVERAKCMETVTGSQFLRVGPCGEHGNTQNWYRY